MNPQEKENLYEVILADTEENFMANGFVWEMYADAIVDYIDNNIVEVLAGQLSYRDVLAAALAAFNDDRNRFNQNWFDRGSLWVAS
jgi:hypothetical protein